MEHWRVISKRKSVLANNLNGTRSIYKDFRLWTVPCSLFAVFPVMVFFPVALTYCCVIFFKGYFVIQKVSVQAIEGIGIFTRSLVRSYLHV